MTCRNAILCDPGKGSADVEKIEGEKKGGGDEQPNTINVRKVVPWFLLMKSVANFKLQTQKRRRRDKKRDRKKTVEKKREGGYTRGREGGTATNEVGRKEKERRNET